MSCIYLYCLNIAKTGFHTHYLVQTETYDKELIVTAGLINCK